MTSAPRQAAPRFLFVGGFLGAGKTTTIARLAETYRQRGRNVAIVTNDQGSELVDTLRLRAVGNQVGEISGACLCGNVELLLETIDQLGVAVWPEVVLVEPIGSCIDLAATVIRPLAARLGGEATVAPNLVLLKPRHGLRILEGEARSGVSPQAVYIFRKQLEEADVLAINRADELPAAEIERARQLVEEQLPGRVVMAISAKTGQGFDELTRRLDETREFGGRGLEVDYARYAEGEAAMGWLNGNLLVGGEREFSLDDFLLDVVASVQTALIAAGGEIAHVKAIGSDRGMSASANLIGNEFTPELSIASRGLVRRADVTINARVGMAHERLAECVRAAIDAACQWRGLTCDVVLMQSFRADLAAPAYRALG